MVKIIFIINFNYNKVFIYYKYYLYIVNIYYV